MIITGQSFLYFNCLLYLYSLIDNYLLLVILPIAGNFRGIKLLRLHPKTIFMDLIFASTQMYHFNVLGNVLLFLFMYGQRMKVTIEGG